MRSFYRWFSTNLGGKKGQRGFTLIELLVVVTILGILAAIVTLSLVGLTTHANVQACNSEYKTVQAAIDSYMANKNLQQLPTAQGAWTNDMTGAGGSAPLNGTVPLYNAAPNDQNPNFTRNGVTQFYYEWNSFGQITGIAGSAGGAPISGCVPK